MPNFSSAQLARYSLQGENLFNTEFPCILRRLSLEIVAGTDEYTLDENVFNIRRVQWLGEKIDAVTHSDYRMLSPQTSAAKPECYVFNSLGQNVIKFFPTPSTSIAKILWGEWGEQITTGVVVEYYSLADNTESTSIPIYFKRRLLKAYVMHMALSMEGKTQDIKAADYFSQKWDMLKELYGEAVYDIINSRRMLISGDTPILSYKPIKTAHLSRNKYGVGVDPGE